MYFTHFLQSSDFCGYSQRHILATITEMKLYTVLQMLHNLQLLNGQKSIIKLYIYRFVFRGVTGVDGKIHQTYEFHSRLVCLSLGHGQMTQMWGPRTTRRLVKHIFFAVLST